MANNYLQFSFMVENVSEEHWEFLKREFARVEKLEGYLPFCAEYEDHHESVWFYSDEYGEPEYVAEVLYNYLAEFSLDKSISFSWASTCSKLRLDEFTGGGCFITKDDVEFMIVDTWLGKKEAEWRAKKEA